MIIFHYFFMFEAKLLFLEYLVFYFFIFHVRKKNICLDFLKVFYSL